MHIRAKCDRTSLLTARKGLPGHAIYAVVRNASELIARLLGGLSEAERIVGVRKLREAGVDGAEVRRLGITWPVLKAGGFTVAELRTCFDVPQLAAAGFGEKWQMLEGREVFILEGHAGLPEGLKHLPDRAFYGCSSLRSVTIPSSVVAIGGWAFYSCSSLSSVTIPSSVITIGDRAFSGCSSLSSVSIPPSITVIGAYTFRDCSTLSAVAIPSSVTRIGDGAFSGCSSLSSVAIPSSVTSFGDGAFLGTNVASSNNAHKGSPSNPSSMCALL